MGEYLILGAIVGWAIYYLGRTLLGRRGGGGCSSCGGACGSEGSCPDDSGGGKRGGNAGSADGPDLKGPPTKK